MNIWTREQCCLYWPCYCGASIIWCYFGPSIIRSGRERSESWENATRLGSGGENWDNSSSSSPEAVPISWIKAQMSPCCHQAIWVLPPSSCIIIVIPFDQMSVCWREGVGGVSRWCQYFLATHRIFQLLEFAIPSAAATAASCHKNLSLLIGQELWMLASHWSRASCSDLPGRDMSFIANDIGGSEGQTLSQRVQRTKSTRSRSLDSEGPLDFSQTIFFWQLPDSYNILPTINRCLLGPLSLFPDHHHHYHRHQHHQHHHHYHHHQHHHHHHHHQHHNLFWHFRMQKQPLKEKRDFIKVRRVLLFVLFSTLEQSPQ